MLRHADHLQTFLSTPAELTAAGLPSWAVDALGDCTVLVDRQKDIVAEANKHFGPGTTGAFILIELPGWTPQDEDSDQLVLDLAHGITAWFLPTVLEGREADTFDIILHALLLAVQSYQPPEDDERAYCYRWRVGPGALVPDENFLIYGFTATITEDLSDQVPLT